jgi:hypothetical protein
MLLKSAVTAHEILSAQGLSDSDRAFYEGKILTGRFAVSNFLPEVEGLARAIQEWDRSILEIREESF